MKNRKFSVARRENVRKNVQKDGGPYFLAAGGGKGSYFRLRRRRAQAGKKRGGVLFSSPRERSRSPRRLILSGIVN